uniref:HECT-type E3 ubiquitin transferase n=1 Tax=Albugo laibachii Nc14 TaxID=890382 RepID=F0WJC1_9STRA|nr:HECT E3 ubiquitin ligase putative [Albugo laibachii Nc14]|eukprot:CCA21368.1 HECT E3 ubiquitin ligase putative [Albugo laibachii Nc14]
MIDPTGWISIVGSIIAIIGLVFVYIFVRKIHQYRHTFSFLQSLRSQSQDNLNTTSTILYREELLDSYTEQALWTCSLCQFQNHPDRKCCDLCQTARGFDFFKTWKWFQTKKKPQENSKLKSDPNTSPEAIPSVQLSELQAPKADADDSIRISFENTVHEEQVDASNNVENQKEENFYISDTTASLPLNKVQLAAHRRQLWRRLPICDGLHRWVRSTKKQNVSKPRAENEPPFSAMERQSAASVGYIRVRNPQGRLTLNDSESVATDFHYRINIVGNSGTSELVMSLDRVHNLPFPSKIRWFSIELHRLWLPWESGHVRIVVRRDQIVEDSFAVLKELKMYQLRQRWRVEFAGEPALDAGGVLREWFTILFSELFDPQRGLFTFTNGEDPHYWINTYSSEFYTPQEHLQYFKFAGMLVGKAIMEEQVLPIHLALPFLKHILGIPISFSDLQFLDDQFHRSAREIQRSDDVKSLCLDFTVTRSIDPILLEDNCRSIKVSKPVIHELVENGREKDVTNENKHEYLDLLFKYHMLDSIADQLLAFLTALYDVVPEGLLKLFDYQELELLMCGVPTLDVKDWRKHCEFKYRKAQHPTFKETQNVKWFWEILEKEFSNQDRVRLLQFTTGTSRVPAQGFKGLISSDGRVRKFTVMFSGMEPTVLLPRAHTCFNRLDIPIYKTKSRMLEYLNLIVQMDITGFSIE